MFFLLESLPDSVIAEGDNAIVDWLNKNSNMHVGQQGDFATFGLIGCVSAIGTALFTNLIPFAKIAKIKAAIKAAGGATTFVKTLMSAYKAAKNAGKATWDAVKIAVSKAGEKAGPEATRALIKLFNVGNVYSACFE
ncbi:hypothetical protein ABNB63_17820 [Paenibacillus larvae]